MRKFLAIIGLLTLLAVMACVTISVAYSILAPSPPKPTPEIRRSGQAERDLGQRSISFSSASQATELLKLIEAEPNKIDYQIIYQTEEDVVIFAANFEKNAIVRLHNQPDGHGTQEVWLDYVMERLANAAGGGSLNDTPEGKIFAKQESF